MPAKYPSIPPATFLPQSNQPSNNLMQGHIPQMFPGNLERQSSQRFSPSFHQNNSNLQQDKHPMAVQRTEVPRPPFPAGQFVTNRQTTNSSPNSHSFSCQGQVPFPTSNNLINMDSNIAGMEHFTSPFPTGAPQLLQSTSIQTASRVPVPNEQSSSMTLPESLPGPFLGPISGHPVVAPMQFPPPFPSTPPTMLPVAPPVIQPPNLTVQKPQETTSQQRINNFLKERRIVKQEIQASEKVHMKVCT